MRPLSNRVIVRPVEEAPVTKSGIFVPTSFVGTVLQGEVIAAGKGAVTMSGDLIPMEVSVGDKVLFPKDRGVQVKFEDEDVYIFHETDLYCIL